MESQIIELNGKKYKITYEEIEEPISGFHREKGQYYWSMNGYDSEPFKYCDTFSQGDNAALFLNKRRRRICCKKRTSFQKNVEIFVSEWLTKYDGT